MSAPAQHAATRLRNLRRLQVASAILLGLALAALLLGSVKFAVAAIVAAIFPNIAAIEALRVTLAEQPERRR